MDKFAHFTNLDERAAFTQVRFGHDEGILEVELNELQRLQELRRTELVRAAVPSGFLELVRDGFTGEPIVYNPQENGLLLVNKICLAPCRAVVAGHVVNLHGSFLYNKLHDYILVDLGKTGEESTKDTLVYLEVWFETTGGGDVARAHGYVDGDKLGTIALDERVGAETSRRVTLRWAIRVKNECDFDRYPEGLGYNDVLSYSAVFAEAGGQFGTVPNVNAVFAPASMSFFADEPFFNDPGLYVAGRPDYLVNSTTLFGGYVFALPMFRIRRRNRTAWSIDNPNGAPSYNRMFVANDSSEVGDLLAGMRPDRAAYDVVDVNDVLDIRRSVKFGSIDLEHVGDDTVRQLLNGELTTGGRPRTRRVQFGNAHLPFEEVPYATLVVPFDRSIRPTIPAYNPADPIVVDQSMSYVDSVHGAGVIIDNQREITYAIRKTAATALMSSQAGTVDMFIRPLWNGCDATVNQTILSLTNESGSPILRLRKDGARLILSQFNYEESANNPDYVENTAVVDLTSTILVAKRVYHLRIAWTASPMPLNGQIFLYLNTVLVAQATFNPTSLVAHHLVLGSTDNQVNRGVVIDSLIAYSRSFELLSSTSLYGYARNRFWPMIPTDFRTLGDDGALLMPSMNSVVTNFSDNAFLQGDTVLHLTYDKAEELKTFRITLNHDKYVDDVTRVYELSGDVVTGVWTGVGTNEATFRPYDQTVEQVLAQVTIALEPGCGGNDLPSEMLAAGVVAYDDEEKVTGSYVYGLRLIQEVSFAERSATIPRKVNLLRPRKVAGTEDAAYDFANESRGKGDCWARLLYYNVSGNGTNTYDIPMHLYGYKVVGVVGCSNNVRILKVTKTPNPVFGEEDLKFTVYLTGPLLYGATMTLHLATEGLSFDYDTNSKTLVTNVCRCSVLEFAADGIRSTYTMPCNALAVEGKIHGGVLKSVLTFTSNEFNEDGDLIGHETEVQCYHDGEQFFDEHGQLTDKRVFNTMPARITDASYGTPFITILFDDADKPREGVIVQIPIVTTYQLTEATMLSVWYRYTPYQGVLDTALTNVRRLSDWSFFITTLSTGKPRDAEIARNMVNNLPGGMAYGYRVDNKDITITSVFSNMSSALVGSALNRKFVMLNDVMLQTDDDVCLLTSELAIMKNAARFQDAMIDFNNVDFHVFLHDCRQAINKYVGGWCVVRVASGEVMILVIGVIDEVSTTLNHLRPMYGDLFRITGRPTMR